MRIGRDLRDQTLERGGWSTYLENILELDDLATNSTIPN